MSFLGGIFDNVVDVFQDMGKTTTRAIKSTGEILGGTKPSAKTTAQPILTPEQQALLDSLTKMFQTKGGDLAGFDTYTGIAGAPANNLQGMSLAALEQMSMNMSSPDSNKALAEGQLGSFLRGEKTGESSFNEFFKSNIQDPAVEAFNEDVLPSISRNYGGASFFGSDRQKADQRATKDLTTGLTRERAAGQYAERDKNIETLLAAIGLAPQVESGFAGISSSMLDSSLKARESEQNTLDAMFKRYLSEQALRGDAFQQMLSVLQTPAFENIVLNNPGQKGVLGDALVAYIGNKCAIAICVFGITNPEWLKFFVWKETNAPHWFKNWYNYNAVVVANYIQDEVFIKAAIRIWMRWIIR